MDGAAAGGRRRLDVGGDEEGVKRLEGETADLTPADSALYLSRLAEFRDDQGRPEEAEALRRQA